MSDFLLVSVQTLDKKGSSKKTSTSRPFERLETLRFASTQRERISFYVWCVCVHELTAFVARPPLELCCLFQRNGHLLVAAHRKKEAHGRVKASLENRRGGWVLTSQVSALKFGEDHVSLTPGHASTPMGSHFGVFGARPILVFFIRDWDVHWGYDLGFDHGHLNSVSDFSHFLGLDKSGW